MGLTQTSTREVVRQVTVQFPPVLRLQIFSLKLSSQPRPMTNTETQALADLIQGRGRGVESQAESELLISTRLGSEPGTLGPNCLLIF